jgi:hypothetical protein
VEKSAVRQVFLRVLPFSPVSVNLPIFIILYQKGEKTKQNNLNKNNSSSDMGKPLFSEVLSHSFAGFKPWRIRLAPSLSP